MALNITLNLNKILMTAYALKFQKSPRAKIYYQLSYKYCMILCKITEIVPKTNKSCFFITYKQLQHKLYGMRVLQYSMFHNKLDCAKALQFILISPVSYGTCCTYRLIVNLQTSFDHSAGNWAAAAAETERAVFFGLIRNKK